MFSLICRTSQMKWTSSHDVLLGREILLFELWKFRAGSRERGQCLDRIADSLNELQDPCFNVTQKSIRDRLKILERDFTKKNRSEINASGISPEKSEIDGIMEDFMERKEEQEKEFEKVSEKAEKDKQSAEDARNKAMERLSETKRRAGDDPPKKKRKSGSDAVQYLQEKAEKDYEIRKQELELKKNHDEMKMQQQRDMMRQFQQQQENQQKQSEQMMQMQMMIMQQQQQQNQALLGLMAKLKDK